MKVILTPKGLEFRKNLGIVSSMSSSPVKIKPIVFELSSLFSTPKLKENPRIFSPKSSMRSSSCCSHLNSRENSLPPVEVLLPAILATSPANEIQVKMPKILMPRIMSLSESLLTPRGINNSSMSNDGVSKEYYRTAFSDERGAFSGYRLGKNKKGSSPRLGMDSPREAKLSLERTVQRIRRSCSPKELRVMAREARILILKSLKNTNLAAKQQAVNLRRLTEDNIRKEELRKRLKKEEMGPAYNILGDAELKQVYDSGFSIRQKEKHRHLDRVAKIHTGFQEFWKAKHQQYVVGKLSYSLPWKVSERFDKLPKDEKLKGGHGLV